jgi:hypothetical protein
VDRITGNEEFRISGRSAVAGVRGTDFGYDFVATREGSVDAETQVYVFEGSVEVTETVGEGGTRLLEAESPGITEAPAGEAGLQGSVGEAPGEGAAGGDPRQRATIPSGGTGAPRTIILTANEMVSVIRRTVQETLEQTGETAAPGVPTAALVAFEPASIEPEIEQFWEEKDFQRQPVDPGNVEEQFPEIRKEVAQLASERREFLLARKRASISGAPEPEERREPVTRRLAMPDPEDRLRRSLLPENRSDWSLSAERGGAVLTATGTVIGLTALGLTLAGDQVISGYDTGFDNPVNNAVLVTGGLFFSSGMISMIASLFR